MASTMKPRRESSSACWPVPAPTSRTRALAGLRYRTIFSISADLIVLRCSTENTWRYPPELLSKAIYFLRLIEHAVQSKYRHNEPRPGLTNLTAPSVVRKGGQHLVRKKLWLGGGDD